MSITPESVQERLDSEDYGDRLSGVNQLRQLDPSVAFEMIQPLINDSNTRVRYSAVSQLDTLGKQDRDKTLELLRDRLNNDPEADVQAAAADAIGGLKLVEAFEDLQQSYQQTDEWLVQFSIVSCLGELGDPRGFELLQQALDSDNSLIQTAAISALGELGDPQAVDLIIPFVDSDDWQIRYRLAQALGHLGGAKAQVTLAKLAEDDFEQVAQAANYGLQNLGH